MGWCIIIAAKKAFFKNWCFVFLIFFIKIIFSFQLMKMRIENHIHIRHIMLCHFEKGWNAAQSFRHLNELYGEGTISKSQVERWHTPHCILTVDSFRYSFRWKIWRNANPLSFDHASSPVTKFFRNGVSSFLYNKSVKIWTPSALL